MDGAEILVLNVLVLSSLAASIALAYATVISNKANPLNNKEREIISIECRRGRELTRSCMVIDSSEECNRSFIASRVPVVSDEERRPGQPWYPGYPKGRLCAWNHQDQRCLMTWESCES